MNKDEKSLILFFGYCLVDNCGNVRTAHMNNEDMGIAKKWKDEGLIEFGRRPSKLIKNKGKIKTATHYVRFTDKAWEWEAKIRKERAKRLVEKYGNKFG